MDASIETQISQEIKSPRRGEGTTTTAPTVQPIIKIGGATFAREPLRMRPEVDVAEAQQVAAVLTWHFLEQLKTEVAKASVDSAKLEATLTACKTEIVLGLFMTKEIRGTLPGLNQISDARPAMINAVSAAFVAAQENIRPQVVAACACLMSAYSSIPPWLQETNQAVGAPG